MQEAMMSTLSITPFHDLLQCWTCMLYTERHSTYQMSKNEALLWVLFQDDS